MPQDSKRDFLFDSDPRIRDVARELYDSIKDLPLVCPHGHVDPAILSDPDYRFPNPTVLLVTPDHYVTRMLHSHGIGYDQLGLPESKTNLDDKNARRIWQAFADNYHLFRLTPSKMWIDAELSDVFGIEEALSGKNAMKIYDAIDAKLKTGEFSPRALYGKFGIEVLCTTDAAADTLAHHRLIQNSDWQGDVRPTFRPDGLLNNIFSPEWRENISKLSEASGIDVHDYQSFLKALQQRREYFLQNGAVAADHAALSPCFKDIGDWAAQLHFQRAIMRDHSRVSAPDEKDSREFTAHMLMKMAEMSAEDGLVMQLHPGSYRNYDSCLLLTYGPDMGADIPTQTEFTENLHSVLARFGNHPNFKLIVFTLDPTTYSRELAPLAGYYKSLFLGPPWWFFDSPKGIEQYLDSVVETAGIQNLAGFNDDTRAFPSIKLRHDLWRRVTSNWVAREAAKGVVNLEEAIEIVKDLAYNRARKTYNLAHS